jgi:hypothetical protein
MNSLSTQAMLPIHTAHNFGSLLSEGRYEEASDLLADGFCLKSLKFNFPTKEAWLKGFPKVHKDIPDFKAFVECKNKSQVQRHGKKKIALLTVNVKEVLEFDANGKIKQITMSKTRRKLNRVVDIYKWTAIRI